MKLKAESREGMVVTTVALQRDLHRRMTIAALDANMATAELIRRAITEHLDRLERKGSGRKP